MADPFGRGGSSGRSGSSDPFGRGGSSVKKSGGGGTLGAIEHGAHWVATKAERAGSDIKNIPGGVIDLGKGLATHPIRTGEQVGKATLQTVEHPLRDPFMTALTIGGLAGGVGSVVGRAAAVGDAAAEGGDVAALLKAAVKKPQAAQRLIEVGDAKVPLHASTNPVVRAGQKVYDRTIQKAIDEKPEGKVAAHAMRRVGGALDETARYQQRMREAPAGALDKAAKKLTSKTSRGEGRVNQAALELASVNTTPERAASYHLAQAEKGVDAARNRVVAKLYQTVADKGLLKTNEHGDVIVNEADHPKLAEADRALAKVQGRGDEILARYGIRSPEELQSAVNSPGRYREGATYEKPTPGKAGVSPALIKATAERDRLATLHQRALDQEKTHLTKQPSAIASVPNDRAAALDAIKQDSRYWDYSHGRPDVSSWARKQVRDLGKSVSLDNPYRERINNLGSALEVANQRVDQLAKQTQARVKPTGVIGGESARPGRGHISYASREKKAPSSPAAASPGPVVGEAKAPITSHANTGFNIEHGRVPTDVTGSASRHFRQITRFLNTSERRNTAIRTGSNVRRSARDVLVKVPGEEHAKLSRAINEALGKEKPTIDELHGLNAALDAYREELVPGLADGFASDMQHPVGTSAEDAAAERGLVAPHGYKWVDRNVLGDLARPRTGPRGKIAGFADNTNSAVTAATVYFKVGHIPTRTLTNAATNIIQGSAKPLEIAKSVALWRKISGEDRLRALAASGQHGYAALPHEGTGRIATVAGKGAQWWARHVDAPFRFNSIAYEARKAGFDTPEKFRYVLGKLEDGGQGLDAAQAAKIDWVAKRANREAIAYDRLSATERNYITRAFWFYPWTAGATRFAANTVLEHPYKATALGSAGHEGREAQQQELGHLPDYEHGLFRIGGAAGGKPLVADFSTFSPFATPADVLDTVARPAEAAGFLNPVYAGANALINGLTAYGTKSTSPIKDALATIVAPLPETQIAIGALNAGSDQSKRMFPASPAFHGTLSPLLRALVGPGAPRRINLTAAHSAAARQRVGR